MNGTLHIELDHAAPSAPWENGYAESLGSPFGHELLNREEFEDVSEAWARGTQCRLKYNAPLAVECLGAPDPGGVCRRLCG